MSHSRLKELLAKFLRGEEISKYPVVETRILSLSPLQITDDYQKFIDVSSLEDRVTEELGGALEKGMKLILQEWKFVLRRIPNSHEYFFDLSVAKYKLQEDAFTIKPEHEPIKMEDDTEIRYLFEIRKRAEIEKMLRGTGKDAPSRGEAADKTPAKATLGKDDTTMASAKISEVKGQIPEMTTQEFQKALYAKPSTAKTEGKNSPTHFETSFFKKAGIISANTKYSPEDSLYLTIAELMSVPAWIPQVKRSVIRFMPPIRQRRSPSSESNLEDLQRESVSKMVQRFSAESSRPRSTLDFEDVHDYLMTGALRWDQIVFRKSALDYLKKHRTLLEQTD